MVNALPATTIRRPDFLPVKSPGRIPRFFIPSSIGSKAGLLRVYARVGKEGIASRDQALILALLQLDKKQKMRVVTRTGFLHYIVFPDLWFKILSFKSRHMCRNEIAASGANLARYFGKSRRSLEWVATEAGGNPNV